MERTRNLLFRVLLNKKRYNDAIIQLCKYGSVSTTSSNSPTSAVPPAPPSTQGRPEKIEKISQAMKAYLEKAKSHDQFMQSEIAEFEIGKRHLANIMGVDPDEFSQDDINTAVEYLLPSGVFDKKARPHMQHPSKVIPKRKVAQFGMDGRPFHFLFYTGQPTYYEVLYDFAHKLENLKAQEDQMTAHGKTPDPADKMLLVGSQWLEKHVLEDMFQEKLSQGQFIKLTKLVGRVAEHPLSNYVKDDVMKYRKSLHKQSLLHDIPALKYDESGRGYCVGEGKRKTAVAKVTVLDKGTGEVFINGKDMLTYFPRLMDREQIMFPLQFVDKLGEIDLHCHVEGGGPSGQAGAIRLATATSLQSFVDRQMVEKMRLAGLLTQDPRKVERQKPGQSGARRKYTWKKR